MIIVRRGGVPFVVIESSERNSRWYLDHQDLRRNRGHQSDCRARIPNGWISEEDAAVLVEENTIPIENNEFSEGLGVLLVL